MRFATYPCVLTVCAISGAVAIMPARAADPCAPFTWDVHHERVLFAQQPQPLAATETLAASQTLTTDQLYQVQLRKQSAVTFVAPPRKKAGADEAYAGLASLKLNRAGVYRIALDQPVWVDVFADGTLVAAKDFQGRAGCNAPHKIVEFVLPAGRSITLQFSGGRAPVVRATITYSPNQEA